MRTTGFGTGGLRVECDGGQEAARQIWSALREADLGEIEDLVLGAHSILVRFDPAVDADGLAERIEALADVATRPGPAPSPPGRTVAVPVVYDGDDLEEVARLTGISREEVIRRHAGSEWTVAFLGFSPGFAYLAGGDPVLAVSRRAVPRPRVPAGAVALAGGLCAVYPQATPGGWQLIGRTESALFDYRRRPPALLAPGDRVRFEDRTAAASSPVSVERGVEPVRRRKPAPGAAQVEVVAPGPLATVQDLGRIGWAHLGVPRAGAADRSSFMLANLLVGNPPGAAALEATASGPELAFLTPTTVAVTGARGPLHLDDRPVPHGTAVPVPAGARLRLGPYVSGWRAYVALAGGIETEPMLGSRSTDTFSGLGPPPLAAGDLLALGFGTTPTGWSPPSAPRHWATEPRRGPAVSTNSADRARQDGVVTVSVGPGPDVAWIGDAGYARLVQSAWSVSEVSDRTGLRLDGPRVSWTTTREPDSEGMLAGAVQLPPGGLPIVLLANHATTGGYPVVAVVEPEDVDQLAQCRPGTLVRFRMSSPGREGQPRRARSV